MNAPLISRPLEADKIRREIRALEDEIAATRAKRDGINRAIAERIVKRDRLKAQLALVAKPGAVLAAAG